MQLRCVQPPIHEVASNVLLRDLFSLLVSSVRRQVLTAQPIFALRLKRSRLRLAQGPYEEHIHRSQGAAFGCLVARGSSARRPHVAPCKGVHLPYLRWSSNQ